MGLVIDFSDRGTIKKFICENQSSVYEGTNIEGEEVFILLEQGMGMDVKTIKKEKPRWFQVVEYDSDGYQLSVSYEPTDRGNKND